MDWMGHRFPESGQQELTRWKRATHCSEGGASQESPEKRENHTHTGTWSPPWLEQTRAKAIREAGQVNGRRADQHPEASEGPKKDFSQ